MIRLVGVSSRRANRPIPASCAVPVGLLTPEDRRVISCAPPNRGNDFASVPEYMHKMGVWQVTLNQVNVVKVTRRFLKPNPLAGRQGDLV